MKGPKIWHLRVEPNKAQVYLLFKERVHSEMKISDKIKLDPNIMPFAFFFSKNVSIPSDINSSPKYHFQDLHYHFQGPALSLPGTCIIASEDLHFHFRDLHYCFRTCIITSGTCIITSRTCIIASRPALFYHNHSVKKSKTNGRK